MKPESDERLPWRSVVLFASVVLLPAGLVRTQPAGQASPAGTKAVLKSSSDGMGETEVARAPVRQRHRDHHAPAKKIQVPGSGWMLLVRLDEKMAHRVGGYADVELLCDGKTASVLGKDVIACAQLETPGTLDQMIAATLPGYGVAMPGGDFLLSSPYDVLVADVLEARHVGRGVAENVECGHLAFRNGETDWQVRVEVGSKPTPCEIVIASKPVAAAPQYTVRIKSWKTDVTPAAGTSTSVPPAGARKLATDALGELDELPQGLPLGGIE